MKYYLIAILLLILIAIPGGLVIASDITDALYYGTIAISNNGTANTTGLSVNMTSLSDTLINNYGVTTAFDRVAVRNSAGADVKYGPGWSNSTVTFPWVFWVPTIGANSNINYTIYTGESDLESTKYIFTDEDGMTVVDDADLEPSDNFSISQTLWIDTTQVGQNLFIKPNAISCNVTASGNITASILTANSGNVSPTGFVDGASKWTPEALAYDNNTGTYAYSDAYTDDWTDFLELTHAVMYTDNVSVWSVKDATRTHIDIDTYYGGDWHHTYNGTGYNNLAWSTYSLNGTYSVTAMRFRQYVVGLAASLLYEAKFHEAPVAVSVMASGVSSGEYNVAVSADSSNVTLSLNGVLKDTAPVVAILDNSNNWTIGSLATPYITSVNITVGGTLTGSWDWEYGATITDASGYGNTATPSYRTTSSDADVSANLTSFSPITPAVSTISTNATWPQMVTDVPDEPATLYSENTSPGFFFASIFNVGLDAGGIPRAFFWHNFCFFIIIAAGMLVFRMHPSLFVKSVVMGALMIMFALEGINAYGMFTVIYFIFFCTGILILSRSYGL